MDEIDVDKWFEEDEKERGPGGEFREAEAAWNADQDNARKLIDYVLAAKRIGTTPPWPFSIGDLLANILNDQVLPHRLYATYIASEEIILRIRWRRKEEATTPHYVGQIAGSEPDIPRDVATIIIFRNDYAYHIDEHNLFQSTEPSPELQGYVASVERNLKQSLDGWLQQIGLTDADKCDDCGMLGRHTTLVEFEGDKKFCQHCSRPCPGCRQKSYRCECCTNCGKKNCSCCPDCNEDLTSDYTYPHICPNKPKGEDTPPDPLALVKCEICDGYYCNCPKPPQESAQPETKCEICDNYYGVCSCPKAIQGECKLCQKKFTSDQPNFLTKVGLVCADCRGLMYRKRKNPTDDSLRNLERQWRQNNTWENKLNYNFAAVRAGIIPPPDTEEQYLWDQEHMGLFAALDDKAVWQPEIGSPRIITRRWYFPRGTGLNVTYRQDAPLPGQAAFCSRIALERHQVVANFFTWDNKFRRSDAFGEDQETEEGPRRSPIWPAEKKKAGYPTILGWSDRRLLLSDEAGLLQMLQEAAASDQEQLHEEYLDRIGHPNRPRRNPDEKNRDLQRQYWLDPNEDALAKTIVIRIRNGELDAKRVIYASLLGSSIAQKVISLSQALEYIPLRDREAFMAGMSGGGAERRWQLWQIFTGWVTNAFQGKEGSFTGLIYDLEEPLLNSILQAIYAASVPHMVRERARMLVANTQDRTSDRIMSALSIISHVRRFKQDSPFKTKTEEELDQLYPFVISEITRVLLGIPTVSPPRKNPDETDRLRERAGRQEPDDLHAQAKVVSDRMRAGAISPRMVETASQFGHPVARILVPEPKNFIGGALPVSSAFPPLAFGNFLIYSMESVLFFDLTWISLMGKTALLHVLNTCGLMPPNSPRTTAIQDAIIKLDVEGFRKLLRIRRSQPFAVAMDVLRDTSTAPETASGRSFMECLAASDAETNTSRGLETQERAWQRQYIFDVLLGNVIPTEI